MNEEDIIANFKAKYTVENINETTLSVSGKIEGSFLFYDIASLGKYYDILHPDVGDIITIDFPDGKNREQYEITEAVDKQIATDGINAFLHKYIWRCKARRYINSYENMEKNEANERLEELNKYDAAVKEDLTKQISRYDNAEDDVYGGYENNNVDKYDRHIANLTDSTSIVPPEMLECIFKFNTGSKLATNGYELFFIKNNGDAVQITFNSQYDSKNCKLFQSNDNLQWLKANDDFLVFNSIDGKSFLIALDNTVPITALEICLNSLFDITNSNNLVNKENQNFYKFINCRTILFATEDELICHFNSGKTFKLA